MALTENQKKINARIEKRRKMEKWLAKEIEHLHEYMRTGNHFEVQARIGEITAHLLVHGYDENLQPIRPWLTSKG